jgi:hypothetical protein
VTNRDGGEVRVQPTAHPAAGEPTFSVAVMGHPQRQQAIDELVASLSGLAAKPVMDPDPLAPRGTMLTARLAWSTVTEQDGASHDLVVQDDSVVCDKLSASLPRLVTARPDAAICLYADWSGAQGALARLARLSGMSWAPVLDTLPAQALLLPRPVAAGLAEYLRDEVTRWEPYYAAALHFLRCNGVPTVVAVPNLVQRRTDLPSLLTDGHHQKRSVCFLPGADTRPSGEILAVPEVLPQLSPDRGHARFVLTGPERALSPGRSVLELLAVRGFDRAMLLAAHLDSLAETAPDPKMTAEVGGGFLFELWLTGLAMSAAYQVIDDGPRRCVRADAVPDLVTDPVSWEALGTVAPGGLSRFVPVDVLAEWTAELTGLVCSGMAHGRKHLDLQRPVSRHELLAGPGDRKQAMVGWGSR